MFLLSFSRACATASLSRFALPSPSVESNLPLQLRNRSPPLRRCPTRWTRWSLSFSLSLALLVPHSRDYRPMKPLLCVLLLFHPRQCRRRRRRYFSPPRVLSCAHPSSLRAFSRLGPRDVILERFVRVLCIRLSVPCRRHIPYLRRASRRVTSACASAAIKIRTVALAGTRPALQFTGGRCENEVIVLSLSFRPRDAVATCRRCFQQLLRLSLSLERCIFSCKYEILNICRK